LIELRSSPFVKINGGYNLERDKHKKDIMDILIKWVPTNINYLILFPSFFLSLSLQMKKMKAIVNEEDLDSF